MSGPTDKKPVAIKVPSKDSEKKKDDGAEDGGDKGLPSMNGDSGKGEGVKSGAKGKKGSKGGKDVVEPEELSEEDKALKEGLELAITRVEDSEHGIGEKCGGRQQWIKLRTPSRVCMREEDMRQLSSCAVPEGIPRATP